MNVPITAETILRVFEDLGLRRTRPRRLIADRLAALSAIDGDFTTDDLWRELHDSDPRLGRATVYRTVEVLSDRGLLDRVEFADRARRYRVCGGGNHHHHLTCGQCHRVVEVEACLPSEVLRSVEEATAFQLEGHSLELYGRCSDCLTTGAEGTRPSTPTTATG